MKKNFLLHKSGVFLQVMRQNFKQGGGQKTFSHAKYVYHYENIHFHLQLTAHHVTKSHVFLTSPVHVQVLQPTITLQNHVYPSNQCTRREHTGYYTGARPFHSAPILRFLPLFVVGHLR
jgi:hypothetical protein